MKTLYKYRGQFVDVEKHFGGVCEVITPKHLVLLLDNFRGKKYVPLTKIIFTTDKTEQMKLKKQKKA